MGGLLQLLHIYSICKDKTCMHLWSVLLKNATSTNKHKAFENQSRADSDLPPFAPESATNALIRHILFFSLLPVSWREVRPSLVRYWQQTLLSVYIEDARQSQAAFWSHLKQALERPKVTQTSHWSQLSSFSIYSTFKLMLQWAGWQRYSLYFEHHWCHAEAVQIIVELDFVLNAWISRRLCDSKN